MKKTVTLILLAAMLCACLSFASCGGEEATDGKDGVGIIKAEIIGDELWITYSDDPENPVNVGKIYETKVNEDDALPESARMLEYYPLPDGTYGVKAGRAAYLEEIVVPEKFGGRAVTQILDGAFKGCALKSITLPNSILSIGATAFNGCTSLEKISLPESVIDIASGAFSGCSALTEVILPNGVMTVGSEAFARCSSLKSVTIPETVTVISDSLFNGCSALESVTLPAGIASIGASAFSGCSSLKAVTAPTGVTSIGNSAFANCSSLTSFSIPAGVNNVGNNLFQGCSSLTTLEIGGVISRIGDRALQNCSSLATVRFAGTKSAWSSVTKGTAWNTGAGAFTVVCTDGEI